MPLDKCMCGVLKEMKKFLLWLFFILLIGIVAIMGYLHFFAQSVKVARPMEISDILVPVPASAEEKKSEVSTFDTPEITPDDWLTARFWHDASASDVRRKINDGANVLERNVYGISILMYAASISQKPEIIDVLVNAGASVSARDEKGQTALMFAANFNSNPEVLQRLIDRGAKVNAADKRGWSPLMYAAARNPNAEIIDVLIANGANVNERVKDDRPIKHASLPNRALMLVKMSFNEAWNCITSLARSRSKEEVVNTFNKSIDNLAGNVLNPEEDMTPLMIAARDSSSPLVLQALLRGGAKVKLYDAKGQTALDYAKSNSSIANTDVYWKMNELLY